MRPSALHITRLSILLSFVLGSTSGLLGPAPGVAPAYAADGDLLASIIPWGPTGGSGCLGIGVAFDGETIWYTCADGFTLEQFPKLFRTNLSGENLGSMDTFVGDSPLAVDAIAWDPNERVLWGGDVVDVSGDGITDTCRIYTIDPATGAGTFRFEFSEVGCHLTFFDGITVDPVTDTLYISADIQGIIHHFHKDGTPAKNDPIDFETLTSVPEDMCPNTEPKPDTNPAAGCNSSGLAIGLDGTLFAGTDGEGTIIRLDPDVPRVLGEFAAVAGRVEDLECGPLFAKDDGTVVETILSRDIHFPGRIDLLEVPAGTCVSPAESGISLTPASAENPLGETHTVTALVTQTGSPLADVQVRFEVIDGPHAGMSSSGGGCSPDAGCFTGADGRVSWSYAGTQSGTDVLRACFTDRARAVHCAEAAKSWIDSTPRDVTAPTVACVETVIPSGKNVPPAGNTPRGGSKGGGQNEDAFYELQASDDTDAAPQVFLVDAGSGTVFGPFEAGVKVKYTQAKGAKPGQRSMGSAEGQAGEVDWHITGSGDAEVYAVDASGNQSERVACRVPPPPK